MRPTALMPVVTMTANMLTIMMFGTMFGTEVPTWLVHAAHNVSIPDASQPDGIGWASG